jgi:hypothetical protein
VEQPEAADRQSAYTGRSRHRHTGLPAAAKSAMTHQPNHLAQYPKGSQECRWHQQVGPKFRPAVSEKAHLVIANSEPADIYDASAGHHQDNETSRQPIESKRQG